MGKQSALDKTKRMRTWGWEMIGSPVSTGILRGQELGCR